MAYRKVNHEELVDAYLRLGSVKEVYRETGVSRQTISNAVKRAGYKPKIGAPKQARVACSKCGKELMESSKLLYCGTCRRKQVYEALHESGHSKLRDKYNRTRLRAIKAGIPFTITFEEFFGQWEIQRGKCFYTDEDMVSTSERGRSSRNISVDKVEPQLGYVSGNVVFSTSRANTIKHNQTLSEMSEWMPGWYSRIIMWRAKETSNEQTLTAL